MRIPGILQLVKANPLKNGTVIAISSHEVAFHISVSKRVSTTFTLILGDQNLLLRIYNR